MSVNSIIRDSDYNNIRNKLLNIISTGSGDFGWGQTMVSSAVAPGNTVSINEWGRLRYDLINAYKHIYGSTPTTAQVAEGNTIRFSNTFVPDTGATDAPYNQYDSWANDIATNRFTVHPSQSAVFAWAPTTSTWPGIYGSYWVSRIQCTVTVTFPSANQARYFFNSGGRLRFSASRTGGSGTTQNNSWTSLLSAAGTREFGATVPNSGTAPSDGSNWYRLSNVYQIWYQTFGSSPYGSNSFRISARSPGVLNNSTGTANVAEFLFEFIDNYVDPGNNPGDVPDTIDAVDGTFSISASHLYAAGVLEPAGTGNFTVTQPVITLGAIA